MSKKASKPTVKDAVQKFTPSTGNESYLSDPKKRLTELADGIRATLAQSMTNMMLAGDKLVEARTIHKSDQAYGKWLKTEFPLLSTRYLHRIRAVAEDAKLRDGVKGKSPLAFSAICELLGAPEDVKDKVLADEKPQTQKEVRKKVKEAKAPDSAAEFEESMGQDPGRSAPTDQSTVSDEEHDRVQREAQERIDAKADQDPDAPVMESRTVVMRGAIQLMVHERIDAYLGYGAGMDTGWAFFIFGVMATWEDDADAPNRAELEARYKGFAKVCHPDTGGNSDRMAALNDARQEVINYYID